MTSSSLYVGALDPSINETMLYEKFCSAGKILSVKICKQEKTKKPMSYAYVNFQQPSDAALALDIMNYDILQGHHIRIMWAEHDPQPNKLAVASLFTSDEEQSKENMDNFQPPKKKCDNLNLYVKNLRKNIDEEGLKDLFSSFGTITSAVVMKEQGQSRGFGFVCFSKPVEATKAVAEMNGKMIESKQLYVDFAQRKEERKLILRSQFHQPLLPMATSPVIPNSKQILGERLFPIIKRLQPNFVAKITGMILELDDAEILHMLDDSRALQTMIKEALSILKVC